MTDGTGFVAGAPGAPVELAPRVWWVGAVRPDETFQCHAYLIEAGERSVLIDPGSADAIDDVLAKVRQVVPIDHIRWVVCHHSDPDIAAGLPLLRHRLSRPDVEVVTEWRAQTLLHHYHAGFPFYRVEEHGWEVPLDGDRRLRFVLTPYLHFPGAMCSWESSTGVLFSSDLFGGFTDGRSLFADDGAAYFEALRSFHEHYMPSNEILRTGLTRLRQAFAPIAAIAPQHGCVIPGPLVGEMFDRLAELECGIFLMARDDLDVARLLRIATVVRRLTEALVTAHDLPELTAVAQRVLPDVLPVAAIEVFAENDEGTTLRFGSDEDFVGTAAELPAATDTSLVLPLDGEGRAASVHITLTHPTTISQELTVMFSRLAPALRAVLNRHLEQRELAHQQFELRESATHDVLTGLLNRRAMREMARAEGRFGVLMIDIDHFKRVNDTFGHAAGDRVLRDVASAVRTALRSTDLVFRYGGEEMLALLGNSDQDYTAGAAERVRRAVAELAFPELVGMGNVTVSVGVSLRQPGQTLAEAVAEADGSLYVAKGDGRNCVRVSWNT